MSCDDVPVVTVASFESVSSNIGVFFDFNFTSEGEMFKK